MTTQETMESQEDKDIIQWYSDIVAELNDVDKQLSTVNERRAHVDTELSDLYHFLEELSYYYEEDDLTPAQCKEYVNWLKNILRQRRTLKKEQSLKDVLRAHEQKIGYPMQRGNLIIELHKKEKSLDTMYQPRIHSYSDIWNKITQYSGRGRRPKNVFDKVEENLGNENNIQPIVAEDDDITE